MQMREVASQILCLFGKLRTTRCSYRFHDTGVAGVAEFDKRISLTHNGCTARPSESPQNVGIVSDTISAVQEYGDRESKLMLSYL